MSRKRAAGAGRKPKGEYRGKSAVFSTRITPDLRRDLEKASKKSGRSLSQEIERRLKDSFRIQKARDPAVAALCYLIGEIAIRACGDWKNAPWHFQAFRTALNGLLDFLAPTGPVEVPTELLSAFPGMVDADPKLVEWFKTPQSFGSLIATTLVAQLETTRGPPPDDLGIEVPRGAWPYAMPQARRDLGIAFVEVDPRIWARLGRQPDPRLKFSPADPTRKYSSRSAGAWDNPASKPSDRKHEESK